MKRVIVMLMAVIVCSLSAWCQSSMIVSLGTEVIENNTFDYAKLCFENSGMPLEVMPSGKYGYMCESPLLMAVVDIAPDDVSKNVLMVKEIDFICGITFWYGIDDKLVDAGYDFVKEGNITLENGDVVSQKTYEKGTRICLIQTIDEDIKKVLFKINHEYVFEIIQ